MATAAATYTWAASEAAWRARLGIATGQAAELEELLEAAAKEADQYLANPFDGSDALSPAVHPKAVWAGMVAWAQASLRLASANAGLTAATTGSLQEQYGAGLDPARVRMEAASGYWHPWRRKVWL